MGIDWSSVAILAIWGIVIALFIRYLRRRRVKETGPVVVARLTIMSVSTVDIMRARACVYEFYHPDGRTDEEIIHYLIREGICPPALSQAPFEDSGFFKEMLHTIAGCVSMQEIQFATEGGDNALAQLLHGLRMQALLRIELGRHVPEKMDLIMRQLPEIRAFLNGSSST